MTPPPRAVSWTQTQGLSQQVCKRTPAFLTVVACLLNVFKRADKCEVNISMSAIKTLIRCNINDMMTFQWWMTFSMALLWRRGNRFFLQSLSGADKTRGLILPDRLEDIITNSKLRFESNKCQLSRFSSLLQLCRFLFFFEWSSFCFKIFESSDTLQNGD